MTNSVLRSRRRWLRLRPGRSIALWVVVVSVAGGAAKADEKLAKQFAAQYPGMRDFDPARATLEAEGFTGNDLELRLREVHQRLERANKAAAQPAKRRASRRSWLGTHESFVLLTVLLFAAWAVIVYTRRSRPDVGPHPGLARPHRHWFQFRLTSLLMLITLVALWLTSEQYHVREREATRRWVTNNGGYAHSLPDWIARTGKKPPELSIPFWRQWIGDEPMVSLQMSRGATPDDVDRVGALFPEARVFISWGNMGGGID
jgi:hypothetical protein